MTAEARIKESDLVRILLATDNHLGFKEKDPERGDDSFVAFEEILQLAGSENVDFILLGGDLFHDAVPSQNSLHRCIQLLRRYTFGSKPISVDVLSDQTLNFHNSINQTVNYEDPNINISIPVFSIHGNHDDPSSFNQLGSLDLLSTAGLINYFGRWSDLTKIEISPILLRKGETQLALYGLSHISDARLARLFEGGHVSVVYPKEDKGDWFNLMVLHQNRADRGPKNYLPEASLPKFLHFVLWGHEHDCKVEPELNAEGGFYVSQPGSSVATSLSEGESLRKHVALLEIYKTQFVLKPIPLQTVRPFVFESLNLASVANSLNLDEIDPSKEIAIINFVQERIHAMVDQAAAQLTNHPNQPKLPIIRLRLEYSDESHMFNAIRFNQSLFNRVANPDDAVVFKKLARRATRRDGLNKGATEGADLTLKDKVDSSLRLEELVACYFDDPRRKCSLKLLPPKALSEITYRMVSRSDYCAGESIVTLYKEKAIDTLMESMPSEDDIDDHLKSLHTLDCLDSISLDLERRSHRQAELSLDNAIADDSTARPTSSTITLRRDRDPNETRCETVPSKPVSGKRKMPQLNISFNRNQSGGSQQTLLSAMAKLCPKQRNNTCYLPSDDSDD